jgi:plasmid maintenance system antidote protein VapI
MNASIKSIRLLASRASKVKERTRLEKLKPSLDTIPMSDSHEEGREGTVGEHILATIRLRKLTIASLAREADVRYDFLSAIIHGRQKLSIPMALKLAPSLGLDASELLVMQLKRKIEGVKRKMASRDQSPSPL